MHIIEDIGVNSITNSAMQNTIIVILLTNVFLAKSVTVFIIITTKDVIIALKAEITIGLFRNLSIIDEIVIIMMLGKIIKDTAAITPPIKPSI